MRQRTELQLILSISSIEILWAKTRKHKRVTDCGLYNCFTFTECIQFAQRNVCCVHGACACSCVRAYLFSVRV